MVKIHLLVERDDHTLLRNRTAVGTEFPLLMVSMPVILTDALGQVVEWCVGKQTVFISLAFLM